MNKIIFIDRDGVLNKKAPEHEYIKSWDEFQRNNWAKELIKYLNSKLYNVIVITNQQWIWKWQFTIQDLENIHTNMNTELSEIWAKIDKFYFCPHLSADNCACRKPKTWMLENATNELDIKDKSVMFLIWDSGSDIECANNFWIQSFRIETDKLEDSYDDIIKII